MNRVHVALATPGTTRSGVTSCAVTSIACWWSEQQSFQPLSKRETAPKSGVEGTACTYLSEPCISALRSRAVPLFAGRAKRASGCSTVLGTAFGTPVPWKLGCIKPDVNRCASLERVSITVSLKSSTVSRVTIGFGKDKQAFDRHVCFSDFSLVFQ